MPSSQPIFQARAEVAPQPMSAGMFLKEALGLYTVLGESLKQLDGSRSILEYRMAVRIVLTNLTGYRRACLALAVLSPELAAEVTATQHIYGEQIERAKQALFASLGHLIDVPGAGEIIDEICQHLESGSPE
jgi:hypothetical protein